MDIRKMTVEEKIERLSEKEKAYVLGYIDRALLEIAHKGKSARAGASTKKIKINKA